MRGSSEREVEFERVHRRVDAKLGDLAAEHRGGVKMGERGGGGGVGQVVGGHVDGLHRGDRALLGRGDPLLQLAHVGGQRRLIAHRRGDAAEQCGHFRARLGEAEDVIDEEQNVLAFLVAEIFGDRQAGQRHALAGARRLVHLAIDQRHLAAFGGALAELDDAGVDHFVIQVVAFAGALTHASEHRHAAMRLGDVVDQLLNEHRLAHPGAAEQADLAALQVGGQQVHHLDAGDQDFRRGGLVLEARGGAVDRVALGIGHRAALVDRVADDVDDAPERAGTDRHADRRAGVGDFLAAHQPVGAVHGDGADGFLAQLLRHFQHQGALADFGVQGVQDERQLAVELHVHHGAQTLRDAPDIVAGHLDFCLGPKIFRRLRRRR